MFIKENANLLGKAYKCNAKLGKYLSLNGCPVLSKSDDGKIFYFTRTERLEELLDSLPLRLKIFK